ncbi:uncharacterized protein LOC106629528 [Zonotrichia albicollis]|uniref:uncharacterized protein LOC106629528 n=1 Tax=Zonotrichia albicollis TaxID=44394 RepID=UPI003D80D7F2
MVEGLPRPEFKGWDLTRGSRPSEREKERKARQGGQWHDRTPGRARERGQAVLAARPRSASRSLPSPGCRSPARSPTSLPSLPAGTRPCGLPGPAALSPPPPFVSKAREQALKERGGKSICFRFVRLREADRRSGVQTLPANAAGAASRVAGAACPGRAAGPGSARSAPPARSAPLPSVPGSPRAPRARRPAPLRSAAHTHRRSRARRDAPSPGGSPSPAEPPPPPLPPGCGGKGETRAAAIDTRGE